MKKNTPILKFQRACPLHASHPMDSIHPCSTVSIWYPHYYMYILDSNATPRLYKGAFTNRFWSYLTSCC